MVMIADLVDEVDFAQRVGEWLTLEPSQTPAQICAAIQNQWPNLDARTQTGLRSLLDSLQANRGLVLPDVIQVVDAIQLPSVK